MNLGMDNKQQEVTYKFMQNLIICILKTKKENGCLILFYFFFFLMACGILVPHQGLKLCPCSGITVLTTGEGVLVTQLCLTLCKLMAIACQAPLSLGFSRQEYWSEQPFPAPGDLPNPGICKPGSPMLQTDSLPSEPPGNLIICILKTKKMGV